MDENFREPTTILNPNCENSVPRKASLYLQLFSGTVLSLQSNSSIGSHTEERTRVTSQNMYGEREEGVVSIKKMMNSKSRRTEMHVD